MQIDIQSHDFANSKALAAYAGRRLHFAMNPDCAIQMSSAGAPVAAAAMAPKLLHLRGFMNKDD